MSVNRLVGGVALVLGLLAVLAAPATAQDPNANVDVVEAVGVLDPPLTNFVIGAIERANEEASQAVVIRLDTDGALRGDVDRLVDTIEASDVPVVVYVGPAGARALGAGVEVAAAGHLLAMAPTAQLGASHPGDLGEPDGTTVEAMADRLAALAEARGRDVTFFRSTADGAVVVAVPDGEAGAPLADGTRLSPAADSEQVQTLDEAALSEAGIADVVAPTLQQVLAAVGGRDVTTAAGEVTLQVDAVTSNVRFINLGLAQRILHTAASPVLAYLLLLGGALTLFFEIFQPGFGVSGVSAIGIVALGIYSVAVLPVSALWAVVALVGLLLLAYDLAIAGLSWPSALGTLMLGVGSVRMWTVEVLSPPTWLLVVGTISAAVFFIILMTSVLRAQGNQALLGAKQVEGKVGIVRSPLGPDGHIFVGGALWRARAPEGHDGKVRTGTKVRVLGLNDSLTLDVEVVEDDASTRV